MTLKTVFQREHCEIAQIGNNVVKITLKGFLKVEHLTAVFSFMDTFSRGNRIDYLMVDQSGLKVLSKEVQAYLTETISIIAGKGLKKVAIIEADDIFAKAAVDKIHKESQPGKTVQRIFHSEKNAMEWLSHQTVRST